MAERKLWINRETLVGIANAIRSKKGTTDLIPVPELETEILSIVAGDSSWCGEYVDGNYKTGAIVSFEGNIYLCIKDLDDNQDPTNAEYWKMLNEETLPNLYGTEVTPTKDIQNIVPEGDFDGFDEVIVNPIPDEYIIPNLQEKTATENGDVTADEGYTGLSKVTVAVEAEDTALPIEVSTEAEMTALLTSGEVGGVYKYTGTTGTYENGALYVLENATITFTIDGTSYEAEEGMTWAEWVESEYNTGGYALNPTEEYVGKFGGTSNTYAICTTSSESSAVSPSDAITPDFVYSYVKLNLGGSN